MGYDFKGHWTHLRERRDQVRAEGGVDVQKVGRRYHVVSSYNNEFRAGLVSLGGRWRDRSQVWSVPVATRPHLIALIEKCYGAEKVPGWMRPKA